MPSEQIQNATHTQKTRRHGLTFDEIKKILPHKEPFIFVDRVIDYEVHKRIVGLKNISGNDPWLRGHFPAQAMMPDVLLLESMAQCTLILAIKSNPHFKSKTAVIGSLKGHFHETVFPGDQVIIEVEIAKLIATGGLVSARCVVDTNTVTSAELTFGIL